MSREVLQQVCRFTFCVLSLVATGTADAQGIAALDIRNPLAIEQSEALKVNDHIYQATGFGNTYMVVTKEGNVIIDTSLSLLATKHRSLLQKVNDGPIKYIIVTHGHPDHVGGIARWRGPETELIAHKNSVKLRAYQQRLGGMFVRRNAAQYGIPPLMVKAGGIEMQRPVYEASILVDDVYEFKLGELTFQIHSTPGETADQVAVWIPELKAAFMGDNMYETFPNMYTLRGTETRDALDWIASLELVRSWKPEVLLPSHTMPIEGAEKIETSLTKYINAIQYVHDETVKGMNEGKSVYELMETIKLPPELAMSEQYGRVSWSVRGIYEGYVGWFDEKPTTMYGVPASSIHEDLFELAGGASAITAKARKHIEAGECVEGLHLLDVALAGEPDNAEALKLQIQAYRSLLERADNVIEQGWLKNGIREAEEKLKRGPETAEK